MSRREFIGVVGAAGVVLLVPGCTSTPSSSAPPRVARLRPSIVIQWNDALLQGVRESKLGPPMVARALAVAHTCMYDAWAAYQPTAVGVRVGGSLRQPASARSLSNQRQAISFATYRAAVDLFPSSDTTVFRPLMQQLGYDPANHSSDVSTPAGIGNRVAQAELDFCHSDGANQLGHEPGGTPNVPYSDYTGYVPRNGPMDIRIPFDPASLHDPNAWQPLRYIDVNGNAVTPTFLGAQWQRLPPFGLQSGSQLRSPKAPVRDGTQQFISQAQALLDLSANLSDEQKMVAEYWKDGPHSETPPGHWNLFAQFVSYRDQHGDDQHGTSKDVKLFFALTNALADAAIAAWDNKRFYDSVRPITAIRYLFRGKSVRAWAGPYAGTKTIDGAAWLPYQPTTFPTPPFPEYCSGHSAFSAAGAEICRLFTGSDRFGAAATLRAGNSQIEPGAVPARDITLTWPTFSDAADQAGISRRYGGIHFEQGDLDGRALGRLAARAAWDTALEHERRD